MIRHIIANKCYMVTEVKRLITKAIAGNWNKRKTSVARLDRKW